MQDLSIDQIIGLLEQNRRYITPEQTNRLVAVLKQLGRTDVASIKREHDAHSGDVMNSLLSEVKEQLAYVQKFRQRITGQGVEETTTRELKDLLQTSSSLFTMLTKLNEDITNQDRLRKIENATVEAIRTLDMTTQQSFFSTLEALLERDK